jgi:hypothetical protein
LAADRHIVAISRSATTACSTPRSLVRLILSALATIGGAFGWERARRDEVDPIQFTMIETLVAEFDREREKAVRQHLIGWLL